MQSASTYNRNGAMPFGMHSMGTPGSTRVLSPLGQIDWVFEKVQLSTREKPLVADARPAKRKAETPLPQTQPPKKPRTEQVAKPASRLQKNVTFEELTPEQKEAVEKIRKKTATAFTYFNLAVSLHPDKTIVGAGITNLTEYNLYKQAIMHNENFAWAYWNLSFLVREEVVIQKRRMTRNKLILKALELDPSLVGKAKPQLEPLSPPTAKTPLV